MMLAEMTPSTSRFPVKKLKRHSQLKHMRISYHFLADLHITRHARETESEKRIWNTLNKTQL